MNDDEIFSAGARCVTWRAYQQYALLKNNQAARHGSFIDVSAEGLCRRPAELVLIRGSFYVEIRREDDGFQRELRAEPKRLVFFVLKVIFFSSYIP